eukprot:GFYU01035469.1.p1 GENE.GFYU01035469.1~~GFYU01035469.1.p1  ORF type:complete len:365 (+),score=71.78 GFYU01035469.1:68-1162(+)
MSDSKGDSGSMPPPTAGAPSTSSPAATPAVVVVDTPAKPKPELSREELIAQRQYKALKIEDWCSNCQKVPSVVEDHAQGDLICDGCGLVLQGRLVDEHSEWRTFSNDTSGVDQTRVGGPSNPLLDDSGYSTGIAKGGSGGADGFQVNRLQNRGALSGSDRTLLEAYREIGRMADLIGLPQTIKDRASELYKGIHDQKALRGRDSKAVMAAAVYIACRQENVPRTLKEICALTRASKKEIGRCYKEMLKVLETNLSTINTSDFMIRFCSNLGLPTDILNASTAVAEKAVQMGIVAGKSPISVAAASIYLVSQLSKHKKTQKEIATVAGVSEVTIRNSYKDIHPHRAEVLPTFFAPVEDVNSLPVA